jgi:two-component system KDP operon response regulator KdpE
LIDDDYQLTNLLCQLLKEDGYGTLWAPDGVEGLAMVRQHQPDLVLLDVMMPRMDGWETCHQIRQFSDIPIIFLSCRAAEADLVRGLELGADDYVPKPCSYPELAARIRAVLRRSRKQLLKAGATIIDRRLTVDRTRREVLIHGKPVGLSNIEYKLLTCLIDNAGRTLTHRSLLIQVWVWDRAESTSYLKVHIHRLRHKIEKDPSHPEYILTDWALGYQFKPPNNA